LPGILYTIFSSAWNGQQASEWLIWACTFEEVPMLWTVFVILLVLWLLGLISSYTLGGFIHILLVLAVIVLVLNLVSGRRPVA
jgi:hypothetical protein